MSKLESEMLHLSLDVSAVPSQPAGAGRYIFELARALMSEDTASLHLITRKTDVDRWSKLIESKKETRVQIHPIVPNGRLSRLIFERYFLGRRLAKLGVDVHHSPHYTMPHKSTIPVVVTLHDTTFFDGSQWHEKSKVRFFRNAIIYSIKHAAALFGVSDQAKERFCEMFEIDIPFDVSPHGVTTMRFGPQTKDPIKWTSLVALKIPKTSQYLLFVGTLEPRKNIDGLIDAFEKLLVSHPDLYLVLAGQKGWEYNHLSAKIAGMGLNMNRVIETGFVSDEVLPELMRKARLIVYPSFDEGFGLPVLEALACAVPVVAAFGTPMADFDKDSVIAFDIEDPDGLFKVLDEQLKLDLAANSERRILASQRVGEIYNWEASAKKHIGVYKNAILSKNLKES